MCFRDEKDGGVPQPAYLLQGFKQALKDSNLAQIPTMGSFFTWKKGKESKNLVLEKLDRALATEDWARKFSKTVCSVVLVQLQRKIVEVVSDFILIMLGFLMRAWWTLSGNCGVTMRYAT